MQRVMRRQGTVFAVVLTAAVVAAFSLSFMLQSCSDSGGDGTGGLQANAGRDMTVFLGNRVWLDGTKSHPEANLLTYDWKTIKKPHGSQAGIADRNTARPSFKPDRVGQFVLDLHVTLGSESSNATVTVTAQYPFAAFLDFDSWVYKGADTGKASDYGIRLGLMSPDIDPSTLVTYAADFTGSESGNVPYGFQVWIIDRSTGIPTSTQPASYPMFSKTDADAMATALQNLTGAELVVISALKRPTPPGKSLKDIDSDEKLIPAMQALGASDYLNDLGSTSNNTEGYSLVGIGGVDEGFGWEVYGSHHGGDPVSISGQLVRDTMQNYAFTYDYLPFETRTSDNGMDVNGVHYALPQALPSNSGGFHVLVLARDTLTQVLHKLYLINNNGKADSGAIQSMGNDLYPYALNTSYIYGNPYLVFISSVGSLMDMMGSFNSSNNYAAKAEEALDLLGGTPGVFPALTGTDTYALLGIGPGYGFPDGNGVTPEIDESYMGNFVRLMDSDYPIVSLEESSILHPGTAADLRGIIRKDSFGWYTPFLGDGGGAKSGIDYSLITTAFQAPTNWEGPDNVYEQQVYADLSRVLLGDSSQTDVRQSYYRTDIDWSNKFSILNNESSCKDLITDLATYANGYVDTDLDCTDPNYSTAWTNMRGQLLEEINDVGNLLFWRTNDVLPLLNMINAEQNGQFLTDYENVQKLAQLSKDDKQKTISMKILGFVKDVLAVASYAIPMVLGADERGSALTGEGGSATVGSGCGLVSSLIGLACDVVPQNSDTNGVPNEVKDTAANLWATVQQNYINTNLVFDQAYTLLTTDWGRLNQISQVYDSMYNSTMAGQVVSYLEPGINMSFYQVLLPVVFKAEAMPYTLYALEYNSCTDNPCDFYVCSTKSGGYQVFTEKCNEKIDWERPSDSYVMIKNFLWTSSYCCTDHRHTSYYTVWKEDSDDSDDYYSDKDILLFQPPTPRTYQQGAGPYTGGMGVSKYAFTARWPFTYEYPEGKSDSLFDDDTYHWGSGCNCSPPTNPVPCD